MLGSHSQKIINAHYLTQVTDVHRMRGNALVLLVIATACVVGCGVSDGQSEEPNEAAVVVGHGTGIFPFTSLEDWKSYADHLAVYEIVAESEMPFTPGPGEPSDEGMIGRLVTARIESNPWSAAHAPALPAELDFAAPGWVLHEGQRRLFRMREAPRLEVGERFLAPLVYREDWPESAPKWSLLDFSAQLRLDGARIALRREETVNELRRSFNGKAVESVLEDFQQAPMHETAARYQHLRPAKRVEAVLRVDGGFEPSG